ncbi:MAG: PIG-L deacetylase family protein [Thermoanaerobaculum sp.]
MRFVEEPALLPYQPGFPPGARWLVLSPHPDDETFGLGATLALGAAQGWAVRVVVLTGGEAQGESEIRRGEARAATQALGVADVAFWDFEDRKLPRCLSRLSQALRGEIMGFRPQVVFAPHAADLHPDHRACARALQLALRWQLFFGRLQTLPAWVAFYEIGVPLWPNLLVSADGGWEARERASFCYASQLAVRPYHRVMAGLAAFRALTLDGTQRAEAFQLHPARRVATRSWRWLVRHAVGPAVPLAQRA